MVGARTASVPAASAAVDWALAGTFAVLPLLPNGPSYLGYAWSPWIEMGALALLLIWCVSVVAERGVAGRPAAAPAPWTVLPLLLTATGAALIGLAALNPVGSPAFLAALWDAPGGLFRAMNHLVDPFEPARAWLTIVEGIVSAMVVIAICRRAPAPARRARRALLGAVVGATLVAVFACFQYLTRYQLHHLWLVANPELTRSHATFEDPNALGSFLLVALGLSAALAAQQRHATGTWALAGSSVVLAAGLMTTVSRAAWGAVPLALILVLAWGLPAERGTRLARWRRPSRLAALAIAAACGLWLLAHLVLPPREPARPAGPIDAVLVTVDPRTPLTEIFKDRQVYWTAGARMVAAHPFSGVGLGRFAQVGIRYNSDIQLQENAHNYFLQLLAEGGPGVLAAFLLVLWGLLSFAYRAARDAGQRPLAAALSFAVAGFALTSVTGHPLLLPSMQIICGALVGAWCVALDQPRPRSTSRAWPRAWLALGVLVAVALAVRAVGTPWEGPRNGWGYTVGLHGYESDADGRPFRWTTGSAWLHLRPPAGALVLDINLAQVLPAGPGNVTTVAVTVADRSRMIELVDSRWTTLSFVVPADDARRGRGIDVHIEVDPVRVPAELGGSDDTRPLGVAIRPPAFRVSGSASEHAR